MPQQSDEALLRRLAEVRKATQVARDTAAVTSARVDTLKEALSEAADALKREGFNNAEEAKAAAQAKMAQANAALDRATAILNAAATPTPRA